MFHTKIPPYWNLFKAETSYCSGAEGQIERVARVIWLLVMCVLVSEVDTRPARGLLFAGGLSLCA